MFPDAGFYIFHRHFPWGAETAQPLRDGRWSHGIIEVNPSHPSAVHELQAGEGVALMDDVRHFFQSGDVFIVPDSHHADISLTFAFGVGVGALGGDDA